jgi:hypothetical protein
MSNHAKQATISRFTNLLDGSVLPKVSVYEILDYYEDLKVINRKKVNVLAALNKECSITSQFKEAEIAEMEEEYSEEDYWDVDKSHTNFQ